MLSCFRSWGRVGSMFSELHVLLEAEGELLFLSIQKSNLVLPGVEDLSALSFSSLEYMKEPTGFCQVCLPVQMLPALWSRTDPLSVCLESQDSASCLPRLAGSCCFHPHLVITFRWVKEFSSLKTDST